MSTVILLFQHRKPLVIYFLRSLDKVLILGWFHSHFTKEILKTLTPVVGWFLTIRKVEITLLYSLRNGEVFFKDEFDHYYYHYFSMHVLELPLYSSHFKGFPIANSVSAFRDETLTIRLATLQNLEILGRKYPATHLGEIEANLPFLDRCWKRVKFCRCGLS